MAKDSFGLGLGFGQITPLYELARRAGERAHAAKARIDRALWPMYELQRTVRRVRNSLVGGYHDGFRHARNAAWEEAVHRDAVERADRANERAA